ncbi:MAG: VWA domain-containing protein [Planctomycetaceae bacterium]|nr:VWA domain-containing protein [Planctomycetaceae bacterium]
MLRSLITSLCLTAILISYHPAAKAVEPVTADRLRETLNGRSLQKKQRLLDGLMQVREFNETQTRALAESVQSFLASPNEPTPADLQTLYLLQRGTPEAASPSLIAGLRHSDPRVVQLSLDGVKFHTPATAFDQLTGLVTHKTFSQRYGFRRAVIDAVAAYRTPAAVGFLIEQLPAFDGQLEYVAVLHLQQLTGQTITNSAEDWKTWWASVAPEDRGPPSGEAVPQQDTPSLKGQWNGPLPKFYDIPIFAKKVVFIIDNSASMLSRQDGETRSERAQKELSEAIEAMAPDVEFNIIAYNHLVDFWNRSLLPASVAAKSSAVQYTYALSPFGKTASYEALSLGLSFDPNTELVVFLSDGKPTAGSLVEPLSILHAIWKQNLFQKTTIDTLGIDTVGETEEFMEYLAEQNYGAYTKIR